MPAEILARRSGVVVWRLTVDRAGRARRLIDRLTARAGGPVVDETERERLERWSADEQPGSWTALLATTDPEGTEHRKVGSGTVTDLGFAGLRSERATATAELAVDRHANRRVAATDALLDALRSAALPRGSAAGRQPSARRPPSARPVPRRLRVWMRQADDIDLERATNAGFSVGRRLVVLGRPLVEGAGPSGSQSGGLSAPSRSSMSSRPGSQSGQQRGVVVRTYRPDIDDPAVVGVLRRAYAGTPEAGWDREALESRRRQPWFDPQDLLVAEDPDEGMIGLHWTKRRTDGRGEVYNLAVAPEAQGRGLGRVLLDAGLAHLAEIGLHEAILWVDAANRPALALYRSAGFTRWWIDVVVVRAL